MCPTQHKQWALERVRFGSCSSAIICSPDCVPKEDVNEERHLCDIGGNCVNAQYRCRHTQCLLLLSLVTSFSIQIFTNNKRYVACNRSSSWHMHRKFNAVTCHFLIVAAALNDMFTGRYANAILFGTINNDQRLICRVITWAFARECEENVWVKMMKQQQQRKSVIANLSTCVLRSMSHHCISD